MSDQTIAQSILAQLGGASSLILMTGRVKDSRKFVFGERSLTVMLGGGAKQRITRVKITLNGNDLYDIEFGKVYNYEYKMVERGEDVPVETLRAVFTEVTGFALGVPLVIGINA